MGGGECRVEVIRVEKNLLFRFFTCVNTVHVLGAKLYNTKPLRLGVSIPLDEPHRIGVAVFFFLVVDQIREAPI